MKTSQDTKVKTLEIPSKGFLVHKQENYGVYLKNEADNSISVQVITYLSQKKRTDTGEIIDIGLQPQSLTTKVIENSYTAPSGKYIVVNGATFKKNLADAISEAKRFIGNKLQGHSTNMGALQDYWSQKAIQDLNK